MILDETDEMVDSLIVFSDYSSIVLQSESDEFEKLCALPPLTFYPMRCRLRQSKKSTGIRRMAADGPRVPNR